MTMVCDHVDSNNAELVVVVTTNMSKSFNLWITKAKKGNVY